ncbi:MAG: phosphatase PAP2 family protein, partial [Acidimicrobiia bacterium]
MSRAETRPDATPAGSAHDRATEGPAEVSWWRRLPGGRTLSDGHHLYWWAEVAAIVIFYLVYSAIRNANEGGSADAFNNAKQIIDWQRTLGIYHEESLQDWALHFKPLVVMMNYFYGSLHFVVTVGVGVYLFRRHGDDYPLWRNALAITTALALIGFITYPLMPPRLLDAYDPSGSYGFVDTLARYPTIWSFNSGAVSKVSNQFAAMPSVHCAWALWCALVMAPKMRHLWARMLWAMYPVLTVIVIVLTANH